MPHSFSNYDPEPEPQASGRFGGVPPRKTDVGVLDPPVPPRNPLGNPLSVFLATVRKFFARR
jgi:hypothetical protein